MYVLLGIGILVVGILLGGIKIVRPVERGLVETFGKYTRTANSGFNWLIPVVQKMVRVNITEIRVDVEPQNIITKDKLNAKVDAVVYYKINDVRKSVYNVNNFARSVPSLARTTLRAVVGKMTLADANENRDEINNKVQSELDKQTDPWGIDIIRVELQKIEPPSDVQKAMNQVVKAENEKIAAKDMATAKETEADGYKRAEIKKAQGEREATILRAEANKKSRIMQAEASKQSSILEAEGESKAFDLVNKSFKGNAQLLKQLEVTEASLSKNSKVVLTEKGISPKIIMDAIPVKNN